MLYIPKGVVHSAHTLGDPSAHVTLGLGYQGGRLSWRGLFLETIQLFPRDLIRAEMMLLLLQHVEVINCYTPRRRLLCFVRCVLGLAGRSSRLLPAQRPHADALLTMC